MKTKYLLLLQATFILVGFLLCQEAKAAHVLQSRHYTTADGLASNTVRKIMQDSEGYLWFGTNNGISCYDGYTFKNYGSEAGLSDAIIRSIDEDEQHNLIVQTVRGHLYYFDKKAGHTIENSRIAAMSDNMQKQVLLQTKHPNPYNEILIDEKGCPWRISRNGDLLYTDPLGQEHVLPNIIDEHITISRAYIFHVCNLRNGLIGIATNGNGFFLYNPKDETLEHYRNEYDNPASTIMSDNILCVGEDHNGNIWLGYELLGISLISLEDHSGLSYLEPQKQHDERGSESNTVRAVYYDQTNQQLVVANRQKGIFTSSDTFTDLNEYITLENTVYCIKEGPDHTLWMGTRGSGLWHNGKYLQYNALDSTSLRSNDIYCLFFDQDQLHHHVLWVGTFGGGLSKAILPSDSKEPLHFKHYFLDDFGSRRVRSIQKDANGWFWIATSHGVYVFDPAQSDSTTLPMVHLTMEDGQLLSNEVRNLYVSKSGHVFISELGKGFAMTTVPSTADGYLQLTCEHYGIGQGLGNNMVQSFAEDPDGHIWLATEMGLSCFNPKEKNVMQNYLPSHTMAGNVFSEGDAAILPDHRIVFSGSRGAVIVNSQELKNRKSTAPKPHIIEKVVGHHDMHLTLTTFNFNVSPNAIRYSYNLNGSGWSPVTNINQIHLLQLSPGHYSLQVMAVNDAGMWSAPLDASFDIARPWYLRWWAITLWILLLLSQIWFLQKRYQARLKLRQHLRMEAELNEAKLIFFTNVSHEFRTPLTLIRGGLERIRESGLLPEALKQPMSLVDRNSDRLMHLVNQLLEFRRMENKMMSLRLEKMDIIGFIQELFSSFSDVAKQKKIHYELNCPQNAVVGYFDRSCIDKVLYNLLSNAIKYTPEMGRIILEVKVLPEPYNQLEICVIDNGVGIPEEQRDELFSRFNRSRYLSGSMGIGLSLCAALVEIHHGQIGFEPNPGGGSVFKVYLPLTQESYTQEDYLQTDVVLSDDPQPTPLPELLEPVNSQQVLVIEDNDDLREYIMHELSAYFKVESASNGEEGLQKIHDSEDNFDLVVTDIMMPGISGIEVIKRLRSDFSTSHIPIVALTALDSTNSKIEGLKAGVDAYLTKPFSTQLLLATLINLMNQRSRLREHFSSDRGVTAAPLVTTKQDKEFIERLDAIIDEQMGNADFSADDFANAMALGRTIFFRKVKGVTGYSPKEYLRICRMKRAASLIISSNQSLANIAYEVGINDPMYFSRCFKQQFGMTPTEFQQKNRNTAKTDEV